MRQANEGAVANRYPPNQRGPRLRLGILGIGALVVVGAIGWLAAGGIFEPIGKASSAPGGSDPPGGSGLPATPVPTPTPKPPIGGSELYGYLPYWEMNDEIEAHLGDVPVDTLALFSVSASKSGGLRDGAIGYVRIVGERGRRIIADAHARGQRVELAFTSFGYGLNQQLFGGQAASETRRARLIEELLALVRDLGVDGLNVDVERVKGDIGLGYGDFIQRLKLGLANHDPKATLSVATTSGLGGALLARVAVTSGADRVFLMGYDYHWSGSGPGASSPIHNRDEQIDLSWSIAAYVDAGVPRTRIVLGLPLYGMSWRVAGPVRPTVTIGRGGVWIPANHADVLLDPSFSPTYDEWEAASFFVEPEGKAWRMTYYDSPRSLRAKLELARSQGLAGAGFWALGYEYGLPGYLEVMRDFTAGRIGG